MPTHRTWTLFVVIAAGALSACGGRSSSGGSATAGATTPAKPAQAPTSTSAPSSAAVTLKDISFKPSTVTIARGGAVTWTWNDGDTPHNVTFSDRHSRTKHGGEPYVLRFAKAGTFTYHCTIHPGMDGKVIVK